MTVNGLAELLKPVRTHSIIRVNHRTAQVPLSQEVSPDESRDSSARRRPGGPPAADL